METELILKLDENLVKRAKEYAAQNKMSLSHVLEKSLALLLPEKKKRLAVADIEISPFVKSMSTGVSIPADYDEKQAYRDYIIEKYK